ncbi:MAG: hypothetical protein ACFFB0_04005 [Promethearchaeota archaeon]
MESTKLTQNADTTSLDDSTQIQFICPVCKAKKILLFPKSVITQAKGLTTMSIAKGLVCKHHFQAFVDKNCAVRGYQRVDFEFENDSVRKNKLNSENFKNNEKDLFENLILEGNYLEYRPQRDNSYNINRQNNYILDNKSKQENQHQNKEYDPKNKKMTLQDIYNEFWEFIDDDNEIFRDFIIRDQRRMEKRNNLEL